MLRIVMAVSGLRIRLGGSLAGVVLPCFRISFGCTNNPPLARAEQARASWIVVVLTSWPMAIEASDVVPHRSRRRNKPADSAGSGMLVGAPNPHRRTYSCMLRAPTL